MDGTNKVPLSTTLFLWKIYCGYGSRLGAQSRLMVQISDLQCFLELRPINLIAFALCLNQIKKIGHRLSGNERERDLFKMVHIEE